MQIESNSDVLPGLEAFATPIANEPDEKKMTARERGLAEGQCLAFRKCASDLRAALKMSDPDFRAYATQAALEWFELATQYMK